MARSSEGTQTTQKSVGQILLERRLVSPEQIDQAVKHQANSPQRKLLGEIVVELGFCSGSDVVEALAIAYQVPFARLNPRVIDPIMATCLPREFEEDRVVLPIFRVDGILTVAVTEPSDVFLVEEIEQRTGDQVQIVACPKADLLATIQAAHNEQAFDLATIDEILEEVRTDLSLVQGADDLDASELADAANESPVVKLVNQVITGGVKDRASDIHIEPDDGDLRIRFRIDGRLVEKMKPPYSMAAAITSRIKIMAELDISERRLPQDGAIRMHLDGRAIDLRVSTVANKFGETVVLRIVDSQTGLLKLEQLGMSDMLQDQFSRVIHRPHGIVLVTGPTGSGKSTTLYSVLAEIARPDVNICTAEDPIELNLHGVNQFQVHEKIGLNFGNILRSLLRQDPDVVMVGEVRDTETAKIAVQAALTGHLVFSTLHTNDSISAVTRLENLGVEPYLVAASLEGVLAQHLVRRICSDCKTTRQPSPQIKKIAESMGLAMDEISLGVGCSKCLQTGFRGRVGIYELFLLTDEIRELIARGSTLGDLRSAGATAGMRRLVDDGVQKALAGQTTFEEVLKVAVA